MRSTSSLPFAAIDDSTFQLFLSLYSTPLPHQPLSPSTPMSATSTSTVRPSSPSLATSPSPTRGSIRRHASAAPAAVTSALGWFSASARAALSGGGEVASTGAPEEPTRGHVEAQEEELRMLERLRGEGKMPWEGWCVEFEVLPEGGGPSGRVRGSGEAEDRTYRLCSLLSFRN